MKIGIEQGLVDQKHADAMGAAVFLFMWAVWRQTGKHGLVLGGMPLTYDEIAKRSGFRPRLIRDWLDKLRKFGYIEVTYLNYKMMRLRVVKQKKWTAEQGRLPLEPKPEKRQSSLVEKSEAKAGKASIDLTENRQSCDGKVSIQADFQSDTYRITEKEEEEAAAAIASPSLVAEAFRGLGYEQPFGTPAFQREWTAEVMSDRRDVGTFTDLMERTAQRCQARRIPVPSLFFTLKREIEKTEVKNSFRKTPL